MSARGSATLAVLLCSLSSLFASGCDDLDFPKSWALGYPRVLAMRAEVVGDEMRATPEPGERLRLRTLIVGPKPIEHLSYALELCPALATNGDLPACADEPFMTVGGLSDVTPFPDELALEFDLPAQAQLDGVEQLLVIGTACTDGDPRLPKDERDPGDCKGSSEPALTWVGTVELARSADQYNVNPELADDAIAFDDDTWRNAVPAAGDDPPVSVSADGEKHEVRVDLSGSGRERFEGEHGQQAEELLLSHFVTAGKLERRFSVLEQGDKDDHPLTVQWNSPHPPLDQKPPKGMRMVFVLRDQRGGVAFTTRELTITRD